MFLYTETKFAEESPFVNMTDLWLWWHSRGCSIDSVWHEPIKDKKPKAAEKMAAFVI